MRSAFGQFLYVEHSLSGMECGIPSPSNLIQASTMLCNCLFVILTGGMLSVSNLTSLYIPSSWLSISCQTPWSFPRSSLAGPIWSFSSVIWHYRWLEWNFYLGQICYLHNSNTLLQVDRELLLLLILFEEGFEFCEALFQSLQLWLELSDDPLAD